MFSSSTSLNCYRKIHPYFSMKILTSMPCSVLTHTQCQPMDRFISIFHLYSSLTCFCNPRLSFGKEESLPRQKGTQAVSQAGIQLHSTRGGKKARVNSVGLSSQLCLRRVWGILRKSHSMPQFPLL